MNNFRTCRTGTPARRDHTDGQECPSYNQFVTVDSSPILSTRKLWRRAVLTSALGGIVGVILLNAIPFVSLANDEVKPSAADSSVPVEAEDPKPNQPLAAEELAALAEGKALYRGLCSGCHGGAGRGGKGPNLTDDRWLHGGKDEDIQRVIRDGVPRTTMKKLGEALKDAQIANIIAYIRSLGRAPTGGTWKPYIAGDPKAGEQLFFDEKGKALCAKCHTVRRRGGRVGPPLDRIAVRPNT